MASETAHADEQHLDHVSHEGHPTDRTYVGIAVILAILTAVEILASVFEEELGGVLVPALLVMMIIKFFLVAAWFMHLRFDAKMFTQFFVTGIVGATAVYLIVLTAFRFW